MPFAPEFDVVYESIRGAVSSGDVGFICSRADELYGGDQVMAGVLREIAHAQLIIGDLTGRNPNVFYELGIAHMTKAAERVLLLTQKMEDVPIDLRAYRCIQYTADPNGLEVLRHQVADAAKAVVGRMYRFTVKAGESHRTEPLFPGPDRHLYSLELHAAIIGMGFVKCRVMARRHGVGTAPELVEDNTYGFRDGETRSIANSPWQLRVDRITETSAVFAVISTSS